MPWRAPWHSGPDPDAYLLRRLVLRDYLAVERTRLANERTLLAYLRTAFGLLAGGATLLHFFDDPLARAAGWTLLPLALLAGLAGALRFAAVRRRVLRYADASLPEEEAPQPDAP
jgi:putative membrane protein